MKWPTKEEGQANAGLALSCSFMFRAFYSG